MTSHGRTVWGNFAATAGEGMIGSLVFYSFRVSTWMNVWVVWSDTTPPRAMNFPNQQYQSLSCSWITISVMVTIVGRSQRGTLQMHWTMLKVPRSVSFRYKCWNHDSWSTGRHIHAGQATQWLKTSWNITYRQYGTKGVSRSLPDSSWLFQSHPFMLWRMLKILLP